jgi:hypothetical protein
MKTWDAMGSMLFSKLVPQFLKHIILVIDVNMNNSAYLFQDLHIWYNAMLLKNPHLLHSPMLFGLSQPSISKQM